MPVKAEHNKIKTQKRAAQTYASKEGHRGEEKDREEALSLQNGNIKRKDFDLGSPLFKDMKHPKRSQKITDSWSNDALLFERRELMFSDELYFQIIEFQIE